MSQELRPLNVTIGDRNYRIKVLPENEGMVRKTLKLINDKIIEFRGQFAGKDMQDYIAMVLLWFATQPSEAMNDLSKEELAESLKNLEDIVRELEA